VEQVLLQERGVNAGGGVRTSGSPEASASSEHGKSTANTARKLEGISGLPKGQTKAGASVVIGNNYEVADIAPSRVFPAASTLGRVVRASPIAESHTISIVWPLPSQLLRYRRNPAGYVSMLLGDEGDGSVLSYLKHDLGLVEGISAGIDLDSSGFSLMGVDMTLSPTAMRGNTSHQEQVLETCLSAVFGYCNMLRKLQAPPKWIWDE